MRYAFLSRSSASERVRNAATHREPSKENKSFIENNKTTAAFDETRLLLYAAQH